MQRFSKKRAAIYKALSETDSHPTADWIYQTLSRDIPDLSLATVYRNLKQLTASGEIQSIGIIDGQEHYDAVTRPHAHFICSKCHAIVDLWDLPYQAELCSAAELASGCQVGSLSLQFSGFCSSCAKSR